VGGTWWGYFVVRPSIVLVIRLVWKDTFSCTYAILFIYFWNDMLLEQLQEFAKFYLANLVFCQLIKTYAK
jgi:hypothetical protein